MGNARILLAALLLLGSGLVLPACSSTATKGRQITEGELAPVKEALIYLQNSRVAIPFQNFIP